MFASLFGCFFKYFVFIICLLYLMWGGWEFNPALIVILKCDIACRFAVWIFKVVSFWFLVCFCDFWVTRCSLRSYCLPKRLIWIVSTKSALKTRFLLVASLLIQLWKVLIGCLRERYSSIQCLFALLHLMPCLFGSLIWCWRWWLKTLVVHKLWRFNPHLIVMILLFCRLGFYLQSLTHTSRKAYLFHTVVFVLGCHQWFKLYFVAWLVESS